MSKLKSIYFNYATDSACPYYRFLMPARYCGKVFEKYGYSLMAGGDLPDNHDVFCLHGLPNDWAITRIAENKRKGCKFVWSVDDDWLTVPDWNPSKPPPVGMAFYDLAKVQADWIICSTPHLSSTFDDVRHKVLVAPNMLDLSQFPSFPFKLEGDHRVYSITPEYPVRILWSGGHTHKEDVSILTEPLMELLAKTDPGKVVVVFQGMAPPDKLLTKYLHRGVLHQPSVTFASYQKILNSVGANITLAPLAPVEFNMSKSNLRILESWGLMSVPVASEWGEYQCIRPGVDGRLVTSPDAWYSALRRLVDDHEYRAGMAIQGRMRVEHEYNWLNPRCYKPWIEAFGKILEIDSSTIAEMCDDYTRRV